MLPAEGRSNCLYDAGSPPVPRLDERGSGLVELTPRDLSDGPICGAGALAFDGDLLRVRRVRVRIRIQAALETNRGAGALFVRPGRASSAYSFVPDYEVTFDVSPRGLMPVTFRR